MAGFVQIIQFKTSKFDEVRKLEQEWRQKTKGKRATSRVMRCKDRDTPNQYVVIAEFASYEAAMKNNELPETQTFAEAVQKLADGPPTFSNLDLDGVDED
jgi:quinol monooxygenase YgiN